MIREELVEAMSSENTSTVYLSSYLAMYISEHGGRFVSVGWGGGNTLNGHGH